MNKNKKIKKLRYKLDVANSYKGYWKDEYDATFEKLMEARKSEQHTVEIVARILKEMEQLG